MRVSPFYNWLISNHRFQTSNSIIFILILLTIIRGSVCGQHERRLINDLLVNYDPLERPVANESEALKVRFGITLQQVIDVDEKNQILITNMWLKLEWTDHNLQWNTSDYGGVKDLRIPTNKIWIPDILMYNSADEKFDSTFRTNVVVNHNGSCLYVPPGVFKSTCVIDITWFPFDDQKCDMKFGSWTYDGFALDLTLSGEGSGDLSAFLPNGEWVLIGAPGKRNIQYYDCCPEPYFDVTFTLHIRRRTLYYGFNLIIPCIILSSMTLLGFSLPPDSGEKLQLGVTILLSMTVFLVQLGKILPATSESISIIAAYFASIMVMVAFSVVMTVVVLNFHHRTYETHEMSFIMKAVMLEWLPWILRMERHGIKPPARISNTAPRNKPPIECKLNHLPPKDGKEFELMGNCRTHFDNILNLEDESDATTDPVITTTQLNRKCQTNALTHRTTNHCNHIMDQNFEQNYNQPIVSETELLSADYLADSPPAQPYIGVNSLQHKKIKEILFEMKFITNRMRRQDDIHEVISEWKFAATVLDRLCLILFSLFTIVSTAFCLLSAPQLIV